jgi:hypothetical protein
MSPLGSPDKRSSERTKLFISGLLEFAGRVTPVKIRNVSEGGAQVDGADLPRQGDFVCLRRGALAALGLIVWADRRCVGIQFETPLDLDAWLPRSKRADGVDSQSLLEDREPQEVLSPGELYSRLAEELSFCARSLEQCGSNLAGNGFILTKFPQELQKIVLVQHTLEEIGCVISSNDPDFAARKIQLGDLRRRLFRGED